MEERTMSDKCFNLLYSNIEKANIKLAFDFCYSMPDELNEVRLRIVEVFITYLKIYNSRTYENLEIIAYKKQDSVYNGKSIFRSNFMKTYPLAENLDRKTTMYKNISFDTIYTDPKTLETVVAIFKEIVNPQIAELQHVTNFKFLFFKNQNQLYPEQKRCEVINFLTLFSIDTNKEIDLFFSVNNNYFTSDYGKRSIIKKEFSFNFNDFKIKKLDFFGFSEEFNFCEHNRLLHVETLVLDINEFLKQTDLDKNLPAILPNLKTVIFRCNNSTITKDALLILKHFVLEKDFKFLHCLSDYEKASFLFKKIAYFSKFENLKNIFFESNSNVVCKFFGTMKLIANQDYFYCSELMVKVLKSIEVKNEENTYTIEEINVKEFFNNKFALSVN